MVTITPSSPPSSPLTVPTSSFTLSRIPSQKTPTAPTSFITPSSSPLISPEQTTAHPSHTISSPLQSDLTPYPALGISPSGLAALLTRSANHVGSDGQLQSETKCLRPLVLDLRPNPDFEPLSIIHSININLPTLLMRRYRRGGAVSSFALESFITMPADKDLYDSIQDSWRIARETAKSSGLEGDEAPALQDVVVLDQDMRAGKEEHGRAPSPAWTLVNVLERGGGNCGGPIRVWYLEGGFDAFQAWDVDEKFLVKPGMTHDPSLGAACSSAPSGQDPSASTWDKSKDLENNLDIRHDGQLVSTPSSFPSSPAPMSPKACTSSTGITDAQTAQAIHNAVSLTTASLGATATSGRRGPPVRRESLFSLNTKSLQRPAGLSRSQTVGVSALNVKPLNIPPLHSNGSFSAQQDGSQHPFQQQGQPTLRHKGSWLTVPTAINTASANSLAGPNAVHSTHPHSAHSPAAMSVQSHPMDIAHSASTDQTFTWSATSGGPNSGGGSVHGSSAAPVDPFGAPFGQQSLYQGGLGSKKSFSSTTTLSSTSHLGPSHGIQEEEDEDEEEEAGGRGTRNASTVQLNANLRRHHSGNSAYSSRSTQMKVGGTGVGSYFDLSRNNSSGGRGRGAGENNVLQNHPEESLGAFKEAPHPFDAPEFAEGGTMGMNGMSQFGDGYNSSFNNHTAMVNNPPYLYDDDGAEEGGDNGEQEISCILPNFLYLGPEIVTEEQVQELERLGVKRVLNMARECEDVLVQNRPGIGYWKIGVQDHIEADVSAGLLEAVDLIAAAPELPIYVHCKAGKSRSVTATIAYLITQLHWPLNKAYNHVLTQRPCMCPNIGFVTELMRMEEKTLGTERAGGLVRAGSLNSILSLSTAGSGHTYNNAHHHHHHSLNLGSPKVLSAKNSLSNMSNISSLSAMTMLPQLS
ncbi:hypothetical protein BGZ94_000882 [Podila epigama]|nr:hypothetical protein BGZ94_000882 [Podila epigama]